MKKSTLAAIPSKILKRKPKRENNDTTTVAATATAKNANNSKAAAVSYKQVGKPLGTTSSAETATAVHKPVAKNCNKPKFTQKVENVNSHRNAHIIDVDGSSSCSESEEDIEYDEEAMRKLLEMKIEQAPAAKVIVSEAMMRDALSEINARKSVASTNGQSCSQSVVTMFSNSGDLDHSSTTAASSFVSLSSASGGATKQTTGKLSSHVKFECGGGGGGDALVTNRGQKSSVTSTVNEGAETSTNSKSNYDDGEGPDSPGCPLEKILEFLQAVMTKDYKRALVLAKEVTKFEPNNELVLEYMSVLEKIVSKEEENNYSQESDSDSSYEDVAGGGYSDELTTSSETDSISGEESSTESRSSTSSSDEEGSRNTAKPEVVKESEGNKNWESVSAEDEEDKGNEKPTGSWDNDHTDADVGDVGRAEEGETQCSADEEHAVNVEFNDEIRS